MRIKISVFFLLSSILTFGQVNVTLKPTLGNENNYSNTEYKYWKNAIDSLILSNNYENDIQYSEMSELTKKAIDSLEMGYGLQKGWYENGMLRREVNFLNDKEEGISQKWFENGQLKEKGSFKNGKEDGIWEEFNEQSELKAKVTYRFGIEIKKETFD